MSVWKVSFYSLVTVILLSIACGPAAAKDKEKDRGYEREREKKEYREQREYRERYEDRSRSRYDDRDYFFDKRHRHDRYYPRPGYTVREIPHNHHRVRHHDIDYYFSGGIWYRTSSLGFYVVTPPIGVVIPILPSFYTTLYVGSIPYYYADGVYYRWYPEQRGYVVVDAPADADQYDQPLAPEELYVYPRQGQSEQQTAEDRYICHRYAVEQTGFDPTKTGGGVSAAENTQKRADYNRATKACLEARGYSVQ